MFSLVFISLFAGTLLGLHFRFFILVPALMLTWVVVISIGVASEPASGHFFFSELAFVQVVPMAAILWALTRRQPGLACSSVDQAHPLAADFAGGVLEQRRPDRIRRKPPGIRRG
jgi:p-aminobenzoyl-glutamate transporter AbgT